MHHPGLPITRIQYKKKSNSTQRVTFQFCKNRLESVLRVPVNPLAEHACRIFARPPVNNAHAVTWPASRGGSERAIIISRHGNGKQLPKPRAKVSGEFHAEVDDPPHITGGWLGGWSERRTCIVDGWVGGWPPARQLVRPPNNPSQHSRERTRTYSCESLGELLALIRLKIIRLTTALLVHRLLLLVKVSFYLLWLWETKFQSSIVD